MPEINGKKTYHVTAKPLPQGNVNREVNHHILLCGSFNISVASLWSVCKWLLQVLADLIDKWYLYLLSKIIPMDKVTSVLLKSTGVIGYAILCL